MRAYFARPSHMQTGLAFPATFQTWQTGDFSMSMLASVADRRLGGEGHSSPIRLEAWPDRHDHGLVFPSVLGTPLEPDNLRRSWSRIQDTAGLGSMRFHDMRPTAERLDLAVQHPPFGGVPRR